MTVTDTLYCAAVARSDSEACTAWLQTGRDHKWTATTSSAALLIPLVLLAVVAVALWVAARAMRSTRTARTVGAQAASAPPTPGHAAVAGLPRQERTDEPAGRRAEAHSTTGPA